MDKLGEVGQWMHMVKLTQVFQRRFKMDALKEISPSISKKFLNGWTWGSWTMMSLGKWELKRKLNNEHSQGD
jgi:hypothetical protein